MATMLDPEDWITVWQSELAARAVNRELHEQLAATADAWNAVRHDSHTADHGPAGRPGADAQAWAAAFGAPHDASGFEQLGRRLAELQRQFTPDT